MITQKYLSELEALGCGSDVDALEEKFALLQDAAADGEPLVEDSVYDQHKRLLEALKPDSELLHRNWEKDGEDALDIELDYYLQEKGMKSIRTCTNNDDLEAKKGHLSKLGKDYVECLVSTKLNGHSFRAVYKFGDLVEATTRGRTGKGKDILRHMKMLLPNHVECWECTELTEVRGELLIKQSLYDSKYAGVYASPLSTVTSFRKASASDEEICELSAVCYKLFQTDDPFDTLEEEFQHLESVGFEIPYYETQMIELGGFVKQVNKITDLWGAKYKAGELSEYNCDGIVIAVNDNSSFYSLGVEGNAYLANLAVKMGVWECNHYISIIDRIEWEHGKQWLIPKARIKPVKTVSGQTVYVVPLYSVGVMQRMGLSVGSEIHFRFGGETGVMLLTPDGGSVSNLN